MVVLQISVAMFLVILVGWGLRSRGVVDRSATAVLSRLLVDVTFPALVFVQLLRTVDAASLAERWYVPVGGFLLIVASSALGLLGALVGGIRRSRRTFVFVVGVPNWIFLPLPIAAGLFGDEGVQTILLVNAGAQVALWTLGVGILRGRALTRDTLRGLLLNPGLVATIGSILLALLSWIPAHWLSADPIVVSGWHRGGWALMHGLDLLGSLTIPLSLLITGAQMGERGEQIATSARPILVIALLRLLIAPLLVAGLLYLLEIAGMRLLNVPAVLFTLVAGMPAAVSCGPFADRFGGDVQLAARAVFVTTLAGLLTVPLVAMILGVGV